MISATQFLKVSFAAFAAICMPAISNAKAPKSIDKDLIRQESPELVFVSGHLERAYTQNRINRNESPILSAQNGDKVAAFNSGQNFYDKKMYSQAVPLVQKSADEGYAPAQYLLGKMYRDGNGVPQSDSKRFYWYHKAAEQNFDKAQFGLGVAYHYGKGVEKDYAEALNWYKKCGAQNYANCLHNIGLMYESGQGVTQSYSAAIEFYKLAGIGQSFYNIGRLYTRGTGVKKSTSEAATWYRKAADIGHKNGQFETGIAYYYGRGVERNYPEALKWYTKCGEQNLGKCWNSIGLMYEDGRGVERSYGTAMTYYKKANTPSSIYNLALLYQKGLGTPKDNAKALKYFQEAAGKGHAGSQYELGIAYYYGEGVAKNENEGLVWLNKAADQKHSGARKRLRFIAEVEKVSEAFEKENEAKIARINAFRWQRLNQARTYIDYDSYDRSPENRRRILDSANQTLRHCRRELDSNFDRFETLVIESGGKFNRASNYKSVDWIGDRYSFTYSASEALFPSLESALDRIVIRKRRCIDRYNSEVGLSNRLGR